MKTLASKNNILSSPSVMGVRNDPTRVPGGNIVPVASNIKIALGKTHAQGGIHLPNGIVENKETLVNTPDGNTNVYSDQLGYAQHANQLGITKGNLEQQLQVINSQIEQTVKAFNEETDPIRKNSHNRETEKLSILRTDLTNKIAEIDNALQGLFTHQEVSKMLSTNPDINVANAQQSPTQDTKFAGGGVAAGMAIGTIFPGAGTIIGGGIGALVDIGTSLYESHQQKKYAEKAYNYNRNKLTELYNKSNIALDSANNDINSLAKPTLINPEYNISGALNSINESISSQQQVIQDNTSNASIARSLAGRVNVQGMLQKGQLYDQKQNVETNMRMNNANKIDQSNMYKLQAKNNLTGMRLGVLNNYYNGVMQNQDSYLNNRSAITAKSISDFQGIAGSIGAGANAAIGLGIQNKYSEGITGVDYMQSIKDKLWGTTNNYNALSKSLSSANTANISLGNIGKTNTKLTLDNLTSNTFKFPIRLGNIGKTNTKLTLDNLTSNTFKFPIRFGLGGVLGNPNYTAYFNAMQSSINNIGEQQKNSGLDLINRILDNEGGYANNTNDKGGETNFGISKKSYPNLDIPNITKEQAIEIYKNDFYKPLVDKLPKDRDYAYQVMDMAVTSGVDTAINLLNKSKDVNDYKAKRLEYYKSLSDWNTFKTSWTNRVNK